MTTKEPVKSLMNAIVGIMVGALIVDTIGKVIPTLSEMMLQSKLKRINTKIDKIMKRHNPRHFTMMKAKRSCKQ
jgi:Holliday junction resolvasome RuvABC endonuclease subunit